MKMFFVFFGAAPLKLGVDAGPPSTYLYRSSA